MKVCWKPEHLCWAAIIVFVAFHLYRVSDPPNGKHEWRESLTASVALNYYQEEMSFFEPRVHVRGAGTGIAGQELPVYNFAAAILYHLVGPHHAVLRLLTVVAASVCLWLIFRIICFFWDPWWAASASWGMAFSPLFFYYSYKIMPDILMVAFWLAAIYAYLRLHRDGRLRWWGASALFMSVSACIKPLGISVLLPLVYVFWQRKQQRRLHVVLLVVWTALALAATAGWVYYARALSSQHGTSAFEMRMHFDAIPDILFSDVFLKVLVLQWPIEIWFGWLLAPAFVYGVVTAVRKRRGAFFFLWILSAYLVFILTSYKSVSHDYYTLIAVCPLCAFTGLGLSQLYRSGGWQRVLATMLLCLAPLWAFHRIYHRFGPTDEFFEVRKASEKYLPQGSLVIVDDRTPIDRLYQLNRYGWSLRNDVTFERVERFIGEGGRFLLLNAPVEQYSDSIFQLVTGPYRRLGQLYCYSTKELD